MTDAIYRHAFHAGNHGDVWKHTALLSILATAARGPFTVVDTHAGAGGYTLPEQGEWEQGFGRVSAAFEGPSGAAAVDRWLGRVRRLSAEGVFPGSPVLTLDALGRNGRAVFHETDEEAFRSLRDGAGKDPRATAMRRSGWDTKLPAGPALLLVDPPFAAKEEWTQAAERVASAVAERPDLLVMLWYPVKRWARPNVLHNTLRERAVPFTAIELGVAPLDDGPDRMAGSGVLLVNAPVAALAEIHAAIPVLGPAMAEGRWWARTVGG